MLQPESTNPSSASGGNIYFADLKQRYPKVRPEIRQKYSQVAQWHGTGRYQYRAGKVVDVLAEIIGSGGLVPHGDSWDGSTGNIEVVSVTEIRPYAGGYADMHQQEQEDLEFKYRSTKYWGIYIIARMLLQGGASLKYFPIKNILREVPRWVEKRAGKSLPLYQALRFWKIRSSIPGNYSILIAIKGGAFAPALTAGYISLHEHRSCTPIPLECIAHIEVSRSHGEETEGFLQEHGISTISVIPRELGEMYSSEFSPLELMSGNPFSEIHFPRPTVLPSPDLLTEYVPHRDWFISLKRAESPFHGTDHLLRVLVLQETLSRLLIESAQVQAWQIDHEALRWAAVTHDVRRWSDVVGFSHAKTAAKWVKSILPSGTSQRTQEKISRLVELHDAPFDQHSPVATELAILKDADALERVRLEKLLPPFTPTKVRRKIGLNPNYLRYNISRQLIPLARELFRVSTYNEEARKTDPLGCVMEAAKQLGVCS